MRSKAKIKKHLRETICNSINIDTETTISFIDRSNRVEIREITCNLEEGIVTFSKNNRRTSVCIKKEKSMDQLLEMTIDKALKFDLILND